MSSSIWILDDSVINKIAAGEVVERPASVVKELVENALDAGARSVNIRVKAGGRDLIEVVDDGRGMSATDARLALKRHATSKIATVEDLQSLSSFGFRGEALPSIAAVSRMILETSDGSDHEGIRLLVEGGEIREERPTGRTRGTTVLVEHLFANLPARRKFLKSAQTEYRHVVRTVIEAALSRLDVGFRFRHDEREVFHLEGEQELRQRAAHIFGSKALAGAVVMAAEIEGLRLRGILGTPEAARRTSTAVHLFVNGRPITHRGFSYGLYTGYGELLPSGRYPFACLFLELPSSEVDVNVHPAKRELRFADDTRVKDFVITSVREALERELGVRPFYRGDPGDRESREGTGAAQKRRIGEGDLPWHHTNLFTGRVPEAAAAAATLFDVSIPDEARQVQTDVHPPVTDTTESTEDISGEPMIWQVHNRYLIAPIKGGVLIIDQHAAHERILYEQALDHLSGEEAVRQQLLFPRLLELSAVQYALVVEFGPLLARVGFDARPFGGNTVALEAVPPALEKAGGEEEVFLGLLDDLAEGGARGSAAQEKIAASLACRAAIRFGRRLDPEERCALVDRLFACTQPQVCPHGRPTHMVMTLEELNRRFER